MFSLKRTYKKYSYFIDTKPEHNDIMLGVTLAVHVSLLHIKHIQSEEFPCVPDYTTSRDCQERLSAHACQF